MEKDPSITRVTSIESRPAWLQNALRAVSQLQSVADDWDTYGAKSPSKLATQLARRILVTLAKLDCEPTSITPSAEGGICIALSHGERYADVECFNTGEVLTAIAGGHDEPEVWEVDPSNDGLLLALEDLQLLVG